MKRLEVSGAVRHLYEPLGFEGLIVSLLWCVELTHDIVPSLLATPCIIRILFTSYEEA